MEMIKKIVGLGFLGLAKVSLGVSRFGYGLFQAGSRVSFSADKRAKSLGARR